MTAAPDDEREMSPEPLSTEVAADDLLRHIPQPLVVLDRQSRIVYANQAAEKLYGSSAADLIGKDHWQVWPMRGSDLEQEFRNAMATRSQFVCRRFYPDAVLRCFEVQGFPCEAGLAIQFHEITERAEELAEFAELAPAPMQMVDVDGTIRWANDAMLELLGYAREEYVGENIRNFHADSRRLSEDFRTPETQRSGP